MLAGLFRFATHVTDFSYAGCTPASENAADGEAKKKKPVLQRFKTLVKKSDKKPASIFAELDTDNTGDINFQQLKDGLENTDRTFTCNL